MSPRKLFRTLALAEAVTWTLLLIGMFAKYVLHFEALTPIFGGLHGFVFLAYGVVTLFVWANQKWPARTGILGLATTVIPWATIPFEKSVDRRGMLKGGWRMAPGGEEPTNGVDRIAALVLRRPVAAGAVALVAVAVVFGVLLYLGPPVQLG
ncbi:MULTISPECIES: DUF3817 domain-containing protein [unclassified Arthrobacter]|uniref:DUF3817 domain-containing protein n=1 Tax=unclassified Arthrobacter TaxID=235627 RepID=UPI001D13E0AF|nr:MULTISPECIES: DUF3817 domain-containing protein [unclassified Arthrobacter]MCC3291853.1 DUF3817 domain-containing protein [Arthrobacter sp. zg-Y1110]MCC3302237.1 DUF3817 domain-containing protein [Arthrobacter sp. zg-Y895]UWX85681.1 DUF3817 domain-containing protein [Arthrobacter sp. zg-Y1110]